MTFVASSFSENEQGGCGKATVLAACNKYLDVEARISHFVHDGSSTSNGSKWDAGSKGKSSIMSTSFLAQICQDFKENCETLAIDEALQINDVCKSMLSMSGKPIGVGFSVEGRFCKGKYSKARSRMLKMKKENLRALSVTQFRHESKSREVEFSPSWLSLANNLFGHIQKGSARTLKAMMRVIAKVSTTMRLKGQPTSKPISLIWTTLKIPARDRGTSYCTKPKQEGQRQATHPSQEQALVRDDDVCVYVIRLPGSLTAKEAFSVVFGVFKKPSVWKIPGTLFKVFAGKSLLYHQDQLVPVRVF